MQYPLNIRFKLAAIANQISVRDAGGQELFYVKQKMFKLKENIEVYRDSSKSELLYNIRADRVIDFSAAYTLSDQAGTALGSVKRQGARSLWRATYQLELHGQPVATVSEVNPWVKVADAFLMQVPILGLLSGYFLHPTYAVTTPANECLATLHKRPAFFEGVFSLTSERLDVMPEQDQYNLAILLMMVTLLERIRG